MRYGEKQNGMPWNPETGQNWVSKDLLDRVAVLTPRAFSVNEPRTVHVKSLNLGLEPNFKPLFLPLHYITSPDPDIQTTLQLRDLKSQPPCAAVTAVPFTQSGPADIV